MYFTSDALWIKDLKNKLWRRYKKSRSDYDYNWFKRVKNNLRCLMHELRSCFENNIGEDLKLAPKKLWSYVQSKTKLRKQNSNFKERRCQLSSNSSGKSWNLEWVLCIRVYWQRSRELTLCPNLWRWFTRQFYHHSRNPVEKAARFKPGDITQERC